MKTGVKITKDNTKEFYKAVEELTKKRVYVGIPAAEGNTRPDNGPNNALIGYTMEFGYPENNVPARPALIPGVASVFTEITNLLKQAGQKVLGGDFAVVNRVFTRIGIIGQNAVQAKITNGPFQPLAPRTIAARQAKGNFSVKPLIDTGSYRQNITHVVLDK